MKIIVSCLLALLLLTVHIKVIKALYDPSLIPNNKFGIHVTDINDLDKASELVNSSGGDWGYITIVIQEKDKNREKWQIAFDKMRELHLIPIIRIASTVSDNKWLPLNKEDINSWIDFLNSLNWIIENRYVIIGNEPNRGDEWGGIPNPEEYSDYLYNFSRKAKEKNSNFYILNSGFDASAPNNNQYISEDIFIKRMLDLHPDLFNYIDGWASHSYPNPDFTGSENDEGRGSIKTYLWELELLKGYGVNKTLPVFITETGWIHNLGGKVKGLPSGDLLVEKYSYAFNNVWNDKNIIAVTPFLLNYRQSPFQIFSFIDTSGQAYPFYYSIKNIPKTKGRPLQKSSASILKIINPTIVNQNQRFTLIIEIENRGQDIWGQGEAYFFSNSGCIKETLPIVKKIYPFKKEYFVYKATSTINTALGNCTLKIYKNGYEISDSSKLDLQMKTYPLKEAPNPIFDSEIFLTLRYLFSKLYADLKYLI